jgi:hypothetical protein
VQDKLLPEQDDLAKEQAIRNEGFADKQGGSRRAEEE